MSLRFIYLFLFLFLTAQNGISAQMKTFTVMIDPAGDAKHAGRIIEDSFERGITLQCAEKLKKMLEMRDPDLRVILTRFPGESLDPLQNANFANRLEVNFYVTLHFYYEHESKPQLSLFYFMNNPTDIWKKSSAELLFESYDNAHIQNVGITKKCTEMMKKIFENPIYNTLFDCKNIVGFPFKPLVGIISPALGIEGSLKAKDQWKLYLEPITEGILDITAYLRAQV
jgi:hypothetical protein